MKKIFFALLCPVLLGTACKKLAVDAPSANAVLENAALKAGDTARFSLTGTADYVQFYSGEPGRNYDRIDSFFRAGGNPEMIFTRAFTAGSTNNLSVLVSTDFNGIYDSTNIRKATWTDITETLKPVATSTATLTLVDTAKLAAYKVEGKPMFVAFRYLSQDPATVKQRQATISGFSFKTRFADTLYSNAADNSSAVFTSVDFKGDSARWAPGSTLVHTGLNAGYPQDEDWAVSRAFDLTRINSDAAGVTVLKNYALTGALPSRFTWRYTKPGTYKAVFVMRNATAKESKEKIQTFTITVNP